MPGDGDWYARQMYLDEKRGGHQAYQSHLKLYGHPSKVGYKDILPLWKAEKWDPDHLMELYKAAGAHYFCRAGGSSRQLRQLEFQISKVEFGQHRSAQGHGRIWQAAAKKQGLPFGVSEHLGHSFTFMQSSHGADKSGPFAGVPYDGANPANWDLYQLPADPGDTGWYSKDPRWAQEWYARIYDLVTTYQARPALQRRRASLGEAGRKIVAQLYNLSIQGHNGKQEAVYCCKKNYHGTDFIDGSCVEDLERGMMTDIQAAAVADRYITGRLVSGFPGPLSFQRRGHPQPGRHRQQKRKSPAQRHAASRWQPVRPDGNLSAEMADWTKDQWRGDFRHAALGHFRGRSDRF